VAPSESLRAEADRLAGLLADARGAEILAELQKLALRQRATPVPVPAPGDGGAVPDPDHVGVWRLERSAAGVGLRRRADLAPPALVPWADVDHVPPAAGAQRVLLLGESTARGWILDPALSPALALRRQLDAAAPDGYQCVDLAMSGMCLEELADLVARLPALAPDTIVLFAGSNWTAIPAAPAPDLVAAWADALRAGGCAGLRAEFLRSLVLPRAAGFLRRLGALAGEHGIRVVVVLPEFNLRGWLPAADLEVPVLPGSALAEWYALRDRAEAALATGPLLEVGPLVERMRALDGGTSPVPGQLLAQAALAAGDGRAARDALEQSRDAVVGIGVPYPPRPIREVQDLLAGFAAEHGHPLVDLRTVFASADVSELPDLDCFLDYCHLSDQGIERAMGAVADAVLGRPAGTATPGAGVTPHERAFVEVVSAVHGSWFGQPAAWPRRHLGTAAAAHPDAGRVLGAVRAVVDAPGPMWAQPAVGALAQVGPVATVLGPLLRYPERPPELWPLRESLAELLGAEPAGDAAELDGELEHDLLVFASGGIGGDPTGPGRSFHRVTASRCRLAYALSRPATGVLELTYRMPAAPDGSPDATVTLNAVPVGTLPTGRDWASAAIELSEPAGRAGVNWVTIGWPVPAPDAEPVYAAGAAALDRGEYPEVLPVFGELFDTRIRLDPGRRG